ncbi:MAG: GNAT family N-acetyltransferase [Anaerolineae bacterium]
MITIRPATISDAAGIGRVSAETWRAAYRGLMPDSILDNISVEQRAARYREILGSADRRRATFVAEDASSGVVGFASSGPERSSDPFYTGELYALYILPEYHRHGLGRGLVAATVSHLRGGGHTAMLVWVLAGNPACGFYQRLGGRFLREKHLPAGDVTLLEEGYGFTFDTMRW